MTTLMPFPDQSSPRALIAAEVRAELARKRISQTAVGQRLGLSQSAINRRMVGLLAFDVDEITIIATMCGIKPEEFFLRARRDSNPQPSDPNAEACEIIPLTGRRLAPRGDRRAS